MSDDQAIAEAYADKLKALFIILADAFITGENKADAERRFQRGVTLAREARDTAIHLLPK
jgi:hypothetical protein